MPEWQKSRWRSFDLKDWRAHESHIHYRFSGTSRFIPYRNTCLPGKIKVYKIRPMLFCVKLINRLLPFVLFIGIINYTYAQNNPKGYIVKDTVFSIGKVTPRSNNRIQFQLNKRTKPVFYNKTELKEYSYDGKVFESVIINGTSKFLRKFTDGKVVLYYDKEFYAVKSDSLFLIFKRKDFRSEIGKVINCNNDNQSLQNLTYSKKSLSNFIKDYNNDICNANNFPFIKLGVQFGYNFIQFNSLYRSSIEVSDNVAAPAFGFFLDLPLYRPKSLYLTTSITWLQTKPLLYSEVGANTNYCGLNVNGINVLIGGKWFFTKSERGAYINSGLLFSHLDVSSPTGFVSTKTTGSVVDISQGQISKSTTLLYGFSSGVGVEVPVKGKNGFQFELKYLNPFKGTFDSMKMKYSGFSIFCGFNI